MKESLIGEFVISKAGHDVGRIYLIVAREGTDLYLSDGKFHPFDKPKKKNIKHVQRMHKLAEEQILSKFNKNYKIFDHEIKYAIKTAAGKEEGYV